MFHIMQIGRKSVIQLCLARKICVPTFNYGTAATVHEVKLCSKLQGALLREEEIGQRNASNSHPQLDF